MATAPDYVAPNSLNYTDIKPQAIENKILLCKYQPTGPINGAKGGDMAKFLLSGNGFLDPYSTYFHLEVQIDDFAQNELRFLDRSAHSFINRLVIRSQGTEIERIENYDVIAAMINDMIYSPEQCTQHYWEGFPVNVYNPSMEPTTNSVVESIAVGGVTDMGLANANMGANKLRARSDERDELFRWLCQGSSPSVLGYVGEVCFHQLDAANNTILSTSAGDALAPLDTVFLVDYTLYYETSKVLTFPINTTAHGAPLTQLYTDIAQCGLFAQNLFYPLTFGFHESGMRVPATQITSGSASIRPRGTQRMQFMIPIYSGLIGLLMPEKKLLPLNLLPLDIEIVFNQHALYSSHTSGKRTFKIVQFNLYGNTLFFEQDIHRTLEASVADHGLFIYCNSFLSAPPQNIPTRTLPIANNIQMNLKSINSVHWVYLYNAYDTSPCARKLHFVSHNLTKLQLLNGVQLTPQYPIEGNSGSSREGQHIHFLIELYKAWNKIHDPNRDGALHAYNICGDQYCGQFDPLFQVPFTSLHTTNANVPGYINSGGSAAPLQGISFASAADIKFAQWQIVNKQANVGRSQYGISLEGEELGSERTMITGRKAQYPFQLQTWGEKLSDRVSYMVPYFRADFIVYIRPDLQVVVLGR